MHGSRRYAVLALVWLLCALACADEAARLTEHLERGGAYLEEGKHNEAILEYRNVLQIDPNQADAHYGLARAYLATKQVRKAYWELQETVRLDGDNLDARLEYAQFLLFGKEEDLESAVEHASAVIEAEPDRANAWLLKGRALETLERYDEAQAAYEGAVERAPDKGGPLLVLASFHRTRGHMEEAEALHHRLIEVEPGFPSSAALAAFLAQDGARDAEAEARYRQALEAADDEHVAAAHSALANFLWSRNRKDEAEAVLRAGIDATEEDKLELIYALARLYHALGETAKADAMMEEATEAAPGDAQPHLVLSSYRGRVGDLAGALAAAEAALEADPDSLPAKLRRAELLVDIGFRGDDRQQLAAGRAVVDAVLAEDPGRPEALFVKAKLHLAEGENDEAEAALRRAADARPEWAQAHLLLGSVLFLQRDAMGARAELARALEIDANLFEAYNVLVRVHASLGDHDLAVETGRRALGLRDDAKLRILVAQSLVRLGEHAEALAMLGEIDEGDRDAESHYAIGRTELLLGDLAAARAGFERAYEVDATRYEVLRSLLQLDLRDGRLAESEKRVAEALAGAPDDPRLTRLAGEVALYQGDAKRAEASFQRAIELDPNDLRSYEMLARYLLVSGRPDEVLATYEAAIQRNPRNATLHLVIGSLYELRAERDEAMRAYESAIELDPELAVAKNNLAYLLADSGQSLERALKLAQEAKELLPDNANAADTLGWVLFKKNEPGAAIFHLEEAVERMEVDDPQRGIVQQHLALAYEANGDFSRARDLVRAALSDLERRQAQVEAQGDSPREPEWAGEMRALLGRLPTDDSEA